MWFFRSPQIIFGDESLGFLESLSIKRAVIVSDKNIRKAGLVDLVIKNLHGTELLIIDDIPEEPEYRAIAKHLDEINQFKPDYFISVGGGSVIDSSKILFFKYERPDLEFYDVTPLVKLNLRQKSKLISIPTTSGTGSECTWAAVISDEMENRKDELASPEIMPDYAILDPQMVKSLPKTQTINTATDAITHAIEGYTSRWNNPYSDAMAEKAIELIIPSIVKLVKDPENLELRNNVHIGASMAGLSFSNSQIGLAHALGHSLGAMFHVAHGKSVGIFLPGVIKFNYAAAGEKYQRLNLLIPEMYRGKTLYESIVIILKALGQTIRISETGIDEKAFRNNLDKLVSLASESTGIVTNPADASRDDITRLFLDSW
ncbi:iron-containing alcohol dehydrogenase [Ferroplasma acidiphilum]|uniref:iron-containing alcohol dehydrogenase n=1 Tax=Ferroplasma acidiphilum TaxID=74969 RepID=UPI0023F5816E|nr:iron-containing alcohol dehydrogenase [Ferroplasma acidiphilum]